MNKDRIRDFFDELAPCWDAEMIRDDAIIGKILDGAGVGPGKHILDVACGTGVLFGDYLQRGAASVTAVDISPEMVKIARGKFPERVNVVLGDVETLDLGRQFDCILVYNAFPHFPEPENLIRILSGWLAEGGTLTVAHGMSRAAIDRHHKGTASAVSCGLIHEDQLTRIFGQYLDVTVKISDERMYQVTGRKK